MAGLVWVRSYYSEENEDEREKEISESRVERNRLR